MILLLYVIIGRKRSILIIFSHFQPFLVVFGRLHDFFVAKPTFTPNLKIRTRQTPQTTETLEILDQVQERALTAKAVIAATCRLIR